MRLMIVVAALAIAGPVVAVEDVDGSLAKLSIANRQNLDQSLSWHLFDPESARLRGLYISKASNICGLLNAKNEHGGYSGYKFFYVSMTPGAPFVSETPKTLPIGTLLRAIEKGACDKE